MGIQKINGQLPIKPDAVKETKPIAKPKAKATDRVEITTKATHTDKSALASDKSQFAVLLQEKLAGKSSEVNYEKLADKLLESGWFDDLLKP